MKINSFYPVIQTKQVAATASFYVTHFGFETVFETDWYVSLKMNQSTIPFELAILEPSHSTIPKSFGKETSGLILNFEVDDVDAVYEKLIKTIGLPVHLDIRTEEFGQRHFITSDPNGILLDIISIVPPSEEFSSQYNEDIWTESNQGKNQ
ncbi:VOC family protein [Aureibacillus halotolerans]|uniref:Catechol 2,3-dioxygenase-like lactoylglutathione lyase family enzyme n=1 Tax=Aureibacillus halotolerans TaxID=1508390 RepID=A0A4R6U730_9BACI|nr:VOC family protein [Aureibacillus halotolerans]TDQ40355.1 catechol 2,3-dioxygenase-like lactoylglutathione lyase family enzyme [Aureibacillus halotolerans]